MRSSQILIDHIKRFECGGKPVLEAIWDAHGKVWMIGYGHSPGDVKKGDKITAQQAEDLLKKDMANFNKSTLKKYIEAGKKTHEIQREFLKWTKSGGVELGGLVSRRIWEAARWNE